jgi:hypothetical protein
VFVQRVVKQPDGSEQVAQVSTNDDFRPDGNRYRQGIRRALDISHRDPSVRFRADQDAIYRIGLRDLNGSSVDDPRLTYELVVEPLRPNFELLAWTQRPAAGDDKNIDRKPFTLRRAGRLSVMLDLTRWGGFEGPVQIEVKGLPSGVQAEACVVPAGRNEAVLTIHADNSTSPWVGPITIVGHADLNGTRESRNAHEAVLTSNTGNIEQARPAARLARQMMLSVIAAEMAPIEVALPSDPPASGIWETSLGATLSIPLKMVAHSELKSEVSLAAYGIPEKAKADPVTLKGDAPETSLALVLDSAEVKPGTYAMLLRGKAKTAYARNPEAIAASEKARNDFNQVVADLDAQIVAAAAAVANAKQISAERSEQLAAWQTLRSQSAEAFAAAQQQVTEATERLGTLQQQVSAVQGDQVAKLREIAAQVTTASENARTQIQSAQAAITSLESELGSLQSQSTAAATKLAELESTHQMLTQKKDRATEYVKQLDQQLEDSRKNFGPQDVDLYVDSPAITVLVHPTPTELMKSEPVELAIGGQAMAPIKINRRFGFNGPVTVSLASVAGTDKIAAETVTIGETESEGQLTVTAAPDTPSGTYQATLKLSMKFNNLDLSQEFPWTVTVK